MTRMRTLAIALGGVLGFAAAAAAAEGTGRVGWVDTERVFKEYYRTEEMLGESSPLVREKERTEAKIEEVRAGIEAMRDAGVTDFIAVEFSTDE
nr:hypothetical protein [bacterium]